MGINPKDVIYIVHYGLTVDLADYVQQVGRCGRNTNKTCHCITYFYPAMLNKCSLSLKNLIKNYQTMCIRKYVYSPFSQEEVHAVIPLHNCCTYCHKLCKCNDESSYTTPIFEDLIHIDIEPEQTLIRMVSTEEKELIKLKIHQYIKNENEDVSSSLSVPRYVITGLTVEMVNSIIQNVNYIYSPAHLSTKCNIISKKHAINLYDIILTSNEEVNQMQLARSISKLMLEENNQSI